jgi:dihydroorotase
MSDTVTKYFESMSDREIMNAKSGIVEDSLTTIKRYPTTTTTNFNVGSTISDEDRKDAYKILAYYNEDAINLAKRLLDESKEVV